MKRILLPAIMISFIAYGCSKRVHPSRGGDVVIYNGEALDKSSDNTTAETNKSRVEYAETASESKAVFPETIYVNDAAAKKSVDGRLYYDVKGHRYWKNYKDGKYYIFNKSMYSDPDFQPPKKEG